MPARGWLPYLVEHLLSSGSGRKATFDAVARSVQLCPVGAVGERVKHPPTRRLVAGQPQTRCAGPNLIPHKPKQLELQS